MAASCLSCNQAPQAQPLVCNKVIARFGALANSDIFNTCVQAGQRAVHISCHQYYEHAVQQHLCAIVQFILLHTSTSPTANEPLPCAASIPHAHCHRCCLVTCICLTWTPLQNRHAFCLSGARLAAGLQAQGEFAQRTACAHLQPLGEAPLMVAGKVRDGIPSSEALQADRALRAAPLLCALSGLDVQAIQVQIR